MTRILMIRHGQSVANRDGKFVGQTDAPLSETGEKQAELTAEFIKENYHVAKVYASDLKRAYNTGKAVSDLLGIEIEGSKRLREINAGKWENNYFNDLPTLFPESYNVWLTDIGNAKCDGGETVKEMSERIIGALNEIARKHNGETVAVATHATPIRIAETFFRSGEIKNMKEVGWVTNASVSEFIYENEKWTIGKMSQDAHLEKLITKLPKNC